MTLTSRRCGSIWRLCWWRRGLGSSRPHATGNSKSLAAPSLCCAGSCTLCMRCMQRSSKHARIISVGGQPESTWQQCSVTDPMWSLGCALGGVEHCSQAAHHSCHLFSKHARPRSDGRERQATSTHPYASGDSCTAHTLVECTATQRWLCGRWHAMLFVMVSPQPSTPPFAAACACAG